VNRYTGKPLLILTTVFYLLTLVDYLISKNNMKKSKMML